MGYLFSNHKFNAALGVVLFFMGGCADPYDSGLLEGVTFGTAVPSSTMPSGSVILLPFSDTDNDPSYPPGFESNTNAVSVTQIASDQIAVQAAANFVGSAIIGGYPNTNSASVDYGGNSATEAFTTVNFQVPVGTVALAASVTSAAITDTVTLTPTASAISSPTYTYSLVAFTPGTTGSVAGETQTPSSDLPAKITPGASSAAITANGPGVATIQVLAASADSSQLSAAQIQITFHD